MLVARQASSQCLTTSSSQKSTFNGYYINSTVCDTDFFLHISDNSGEILPHLKGVSGFPSNNLLFNGAHFGLFSNEAIFY